jgi:phosphoribosylformylglycinamidine cyclo-ligase
MSDRKYAEAGVDYSKIDPSKLLAQELAAKTAAHLGRLSLEELASSRGESAYIVKLGAQSLAFVTEALGTKNLVADAVRAYTGRTHYDAIARDTVATILNDLCSVGARPVALTAYWGAGDDAWFADQERAHDLTEGWAAACNECRVSWGGGETQVLTSLIEKGRVVLGGSAIGLIAPAENALLGERLEAGDQILIAPASGIHANGLSLARKVAAGLPQGYQTPISSEPSARTYGEALLDPTPQYAPLIENLQLAQVPLHYAAHITGHGWRKVMRASRELTYRIHHIPAVPPVLSFLQQKAGLSTEEAYGTFNMGAGFALYLPASAVAAALAAAKRSGFELLHAGEVEAGPQRVIIEPLGITFEGSSLQVRR